ncbi:DUF1835 domain-containing protein [Cytobacillus solani]|uniref:DUF1835 domain-containing protein n=1 Tax=Cytobacillus solani TaxID=1637975 RepID=UPI0006C20000|nr:DUF1835 domain-containing protein [Cytobacillus solani]KOP81147.1 hypothetical protein AMS60_00665 [Bacillus sp. FJAT-21945]
MEIDKLKKAIKELPEEEAKSLLFHVLLRMNLLRETEYSEKEFVSDIENIYDMVFDRSRERAEMSQEGNFQMIHILFGDSPAGSLKYALKEMGVSKEEKVISFWDMFSVGPIWRLHEKAGQEARFGFMQKVMNDENDDFRDYQKKFYETINQIISIPEDVPITIWVAENSHEQTGLRYVLHLLKIKINDIKVINSTKMAAEKFNRPDIEYIAIKTGEIIPEKLQVIYEESKSSASMSKDERKALEDEWIDLAETEETLRVWQNEKIKSVSEDYYDQYMINMAKKLQIERERVKEHEEFMKSARLIGEVIGHLDQYMGDEFFEYRLRKLIEKGVFEMEGNLKAMRYYSVRFPL